VVAVKGKGCGGRRPGAGRPRNADVLRELAKVYAAIAELNLAVDRLRQQRRDELEAAPAILVRLTSNERQLGLCEVPRTPRPRRDRPLDA